MNWTFFDHNFWQTVLALIAIFAAYKIGQRQIRINDTVELYASYLRMVYNDKDDKLVSEVPFVHVQNVGTRLIYLEKYIFNGMEYIIDSQILPPTYSQAESNFYRIQLPMNEEIHVSIHVFYIDIDGRRWNSKIFADKGGAFGWDVKTLPRVSS